MKAIKLKTEYMVNPIGLDRQNPGLSWKCEGGISQTAYRILARNRENRILWDSGKIPGNALRLRGHPAGKPG